MNDSTTLNPATVNAQIIKQLTGTWAAQNKTLNEALKKYDDAHFLKEVAPGRNRAVYILGHLVAVSDHMLLLLGISDSLYPELQDIFIANPDKAVTNIPSVAELKQKWETVSTALTNYINKTQPAEWLERHTKVSAEDFAKEPHRNKLAILISRTNHLSYHLGQLALIGTKELVN